MTSGAFYAVHGDWISVKVKARPGAGKDAILGAKAGELVVAVRAPAEKGRANEGIIGVLAHALSIPRSEIRLKLGAGSSHKVFELPVKAASALAAMESSP